MRLKDKVCIITGSGKGMGRAAALLFAREGAKVIVATRSEDSGMETLNLIKKDGGEARFIKVDVSQVHDVQAMVEFTLQSYGWINVLVNNAGVSGRVYGDSTTLTDVTEEAWHRIIDFELTSIFLCCKYTIPEMIKCGGGSIVNCSSVGAIRGGISPGPYGSKLPIPTPIAYTAAKGGVDSLTRAIATGYGQYNIRCNVVLPGYVETDLLRPSGLLEKENREVMANLFPIRRFGTPEDIAYAYLYLASEESSWVSGQEFAVDGGRTAY
jgi:NAD(P)-dependent dehydrogenase (short-subunit alcohol dehydrogenase family)